MPNSHDLRPKRGAGRAWREGESKMDRERFWFCKVGPAPKKVPFGGDSPMRNSVERAFTEMFGADAEVCFSGWDVQLDSIEREIVEEDRQRKESDYDRSADA